MRIIPLNGEFSLNFPTGIAYSFLDPKKQGKKLAAYIIGIALGQIIIFLIVRGIIVVRERLIRNRVVHNGKPEIHDLAV